MTEQNKIKETLDEVLFQFIPQGNYVKVIAVDPHTNTEVVMVGDRRSGNCLLYTSPSPRDGLLSRMPSSA